MRKTSGHESYISAILSDFVIHSFLYSPTTIWPADNMSERAERAVRCHFPPNLREAACEATYISYLEIYGVSLDCRLLPPLQRGPVGDTVISHAYTRFMASYSRHGILIGCQRPCDRRSFRELVRRHFVSWAISRQCPSKTKKKAICLTRAEALEMARLLATPARNGSSYVRFTTLDEAASCWPRVRALLTKSGATSNALHSWLLKQVPTLKYQPEDRAPLLCPSTLRKRQLCARIWSQRSPWFTRLSHRAAVASRASASVRQPIARQPIATACAGDPSLVNVYFDPIFYSQFGFVIDATSMSDREGPMHHHPKCYSASDDVYPPHLVPDDKCISQTRSIMVYCVIHKFGGLLVGPDVMLTGTKLEKSVLPKAEQLAQAGIDTW